MEVKNFYWVFTEFFFVEVRVLEEGSLIWFKKKSMEPITEQKKIEKRKEKGSQQQQQQQQQHQQQQQT